MIAIEWSNGKIDQAETWELLEELVRVDQWREFDADSFREALAKRAMQWSGKEIVIDGTSEHLFRELVWAKMIVIVKATVQITIR